MGGAMLMSPICHGYISYFRLDQEKKKKKVKKKMKILIFVINGHKWLFFGHHVEPNDIWAAAWGAKLIKSEMAQIVTHLPFWFWNLVSGEILSSCVQFFLFVLLISAHITIVEELCVPIRISHIHPTSYYYGSKALCFILKYTALWLHNFLFL